MSPALPLAIRRIRRRPFRIAALVLLSVIAVPVAVTATDYYVSVSGADAADGLSPATAWRSIARVNNQTLRPGDRVLFEGGQTFSGNLYFDSADAGTATSPVVVSSYGTGRATIYAASGHGVLVYDAGGFEFRNLYVVGSGSTANDGDGIFFFNDLPGDVLLDHLVVDRVDAVRFGDSGILVGGGNGGSGFSNVIIRQVIASDNRLQGIFVYAARPNTHRNVSVLSSAAFNISGQSGLLYNSGNGITLSGVDGGLIERCTAHDNGWLSDASNGPIGIWTYESNGLVIRYNESYANRTGGTKDGGGFSLDNDTSNATLEYNYSHDNAGAGLQLAHKPDNFLHAGNVVRYNVTENDGRRNNYASIQLWGRITNAEIYNNTVYSAYTSAGAPRAVYIKNSSIETQDPQHVHFRNNIIATTSSAKLVEATAAALDGSIDIRFENNAYYSYTGTPKIVWGGATYTSLAAWRSATGQETSGAAAVGVYGDPLLNAPGKGGTIGDATLLAALAAYRLKASSPLVNAGTDLAARFGINMGGLDYFGSALPQRGAYDIGAHELSVDCVWTVSPTTVTFDSAGGTTSVSVTASDARCGWIAKSNADWIIIQSPQGSVSGSGGTGVAATANPLTSSRSGTVTIGVTTFSVVQQGGSASNQPPRVSITQPAPGASFDGGMTITVAASAADPDGFISGVDFFANNVLIGSVSTTPYSVQWQTVPPGQYTLTAVATDNGGLSTTSAGVAVLVGGSSTSDLPSPWNTSDVGSVGAPGSATFSNGTFTVTGAGSDIWGAADAFRFVYQPMAGNAQVIARVATITNTNAWTKAGVMMRAGLGASDAQVSMFVTPGKGLALQYRTAAGGASANISGGAGTAPTWVRLSRTGPTITAATSRDGAAWTTVGSVSVAMASTIEVGLALSSHVDSTTATATFDRVSADTISSTPTWADQDVGSVGLGGSSSRSGDTFTVKGAGADIWGTADGFHYVYQPLSGDGEIVARVVSLTHTHDWAKAGVMIRETLAAGSKQASMFVSSTRGLAFQRRVSTNGTSTNTGGTLDAVPMWVRVVRAGSTFSTYESNDGVSWTIVGSDTIAMAPDVFVGLAVTSHTTSALCTAVFDSVAISR